LQLQVAGETFIIRNLRHSLQLSRISALRLIMLARVWKSPAAMAAAAVLRLLLLLLLVMMNMMNKAAAIPSQAIVREDSCLNGDRQPSCHM
jgi:hypothetical protein